MLIETIAKFVNLYNLKKSN